jgi:predicted RNA-binding protein with PIN domain
MTVLEGEAPAALLMGYPAEVTEYTGGRGRLSCTPAGYAPCADAEAVVAGIAYNPEADPDNSPDSVFCSHGAGHLVKWQDAAAFMHTESVLKPPSAAVHPAGTGTPSPVRKAYSGSAEQDRELMKIFEQTYGSIQRKKQDERHLLHTEKQQKRPEKPVPLPPEGPEYLIVDGYNIIFAWDELKALARDSLDDARARLLHILSNYCGYRQCELIVVFDAYRVKGNPGSVEQHGNLSVVYTKEAETADTYIERITHELGRHHRVRVATSDGMEQLIILGNGAYRVSAAELLDEVRKAEGSVTIS